MRLICPSCGAQYQIQEGLIPPAGRDVQCSNCGHSWFEKLEPPRDLPEPEPDLIQEALTGDIEATAETVSEQDPEPAPEPTPEPEPMMPDPVEDQDDEAWQEDETPQPRRPRRAIKPEVADILREEAATDRELRAAEQEHIENQPELGLAVPAPRRIDHTGTQSRRDLLPDVEAINSSLRPDEVEVPRIELPEPEAPVRKRSGYWSGFMLVMVAVLLALAIYILAPQIMETTPDNIDQWLKAYVDWVDALRLRLDLGLQQIMARFNA